MTSVILQPDEEHQKVVHQTTCPICGSKPAMDIGEDGFHRDFVMSCPKRGCPAHSWDYVTGRPDRDALVVMEHYKEHPEDAPEWLRDQLTD